MNARITNNTADVSIEEMHQTEQKCIYTLNRLVELLGPEKMEELRKMVEQREQTINNGYYAPSITIK